MRIASIAYQNRPHTRVLPANQAVAVSFAEQGGQSPVKVLIVEDEPKVSAVLEQILTQKGYQVVGIAPTEKAGEALFTQHQPNLVLLDQYLSGNDTGTALFRRLIAQGIKPGRFVSITTDAKIPDALTQQGVTAHFRFKKALAAIAAGDYKIYRADQWPGLVEDLHDIIDHQSQFAV